MNSSLLSGGQHYEKLVDWKKRLSVEMPFLLNFLSQADPPVHTILEVGCGTGHHAENLIKQSGYHVTGLDIDETMIETARERIPEGELIVQDFMDPNLGNLKGRSFDAIISLGNSIGLIASIYGYEGIIGQFNKLIRKPKGLLIFQILNTEKERNNWSNPRSISTSDGDFIFLRGFKTNELFIQPEILTLFRSNENEKWTLHTTGVTNIPRVTQKVMISFLENYSFKEIKIFGDYKLNPFDSKTSMDMIFVAKS